MAKWDRNRVHPGARPCVCVCVCFLIPLHWGGDCTMDPYPCSLSGRWDGSKPNSGASMRRGTINSSPLPEAWVSGLEMGVILHLHATPERHKTPFKTAISQEEGSTDVDVGKRERYRPLYPSEAIVLSCRLPLTAREFVSLWREALFMQDGGKGQCRVAQY